MASRLITLDSTLYKASCACGSVQITATEKPITASHCHCSMCQKHHASAMGSYASFNKNQVKFEGLDKIKHYQSSEFVTRSFCSCCGSIVSWYHSNQHLDLIAIPLALFDTDLEVKVERNIYTESKVDWLNQK